VGAVTGLFIGGYIGSTFAPPPDPNSLDLSGAADFVYGAVIGLVVGPIVVVLVTWYGSRLLRWDRRRRGITF
jgi:hypothetical protein